MKKMIKYGGMNDGGTEMQGRRKGARGREKQMNKTKITTA